MREGYNKINNWPLNFLRTGLYLYKYGYIFNRISDGNWWSEFAYSPTNGYYSGTGSNAFLPQANNYRGYGFAVR